LGIDDSSTNLHRADGQYVEEHQQPEGAGRQRLPQPPLPEPQPEAAPQHVAGLRRRLDAPAGLVAAAGGQAGWLAGERVVY
jgi:hypothetical protein